MPVTARMSKRFLWREAMITFLCLGGSCWFLYDGTVAWPELRRQGLARVQMDEDLKKEFGTKEVLPRDRRERWEKMAAEHGWPKEIPGEPKSEAEIQFQVILSALLAVPGLLYLFFFFRDRRRWIEMNETGLRSSWGQQLEFGQIVALDKKQWKKKGIARVRYEENGRRRTLVLDDWKYYPKPTLDILREVESRIGVERIVNGLPEPPDAVPEAPANPAASQ